MRHTTWTKVLGCIALALLLVAPAVAQTTGRVSGMVADEQGAPLPGVTVTLASPDMQGTRTEVTDVRGEFRFLGLPPSGSYEVTAQLEGFNTVQQENVRVGLDREVSLRLEMSSAFADEIVVRAEAPVVDHSSTTTGASFGEELFSQMPVARNFESMAFAAPGVVVAADEDSDLENNPSIGGASVAENRYIINGLDTTDPAFGTTRGTLPFEFIQEVEVKTGGYEAEYGGALGGILNVVTKSGSNELHGDVFGYFTDDSLQETEPPTEGLGQELGFTEYDYGLDVGGKIIQDALWYFVAANPQSTVDEYTNRGGTRFEEENETLSYAGKLTFQASPSNQLYASVFGEEEEIQDQAAFGRDAVGFSTNNSDDSLLNAVVGYNGALSSTLFVEASAGRFDLDDRDFAENEAPRYEDRTADLRFIRSSGCEGAATIEAGSVDFNPGCVGGQFFQDSGDRARDEVKGSASWFLTTGPVDHEVKGGGSWRSIEYEDDARYPGPTSGPVLDSDGVLVEPRGFKGQRYSLRDGFYILYDYRQDSQGETDEVALFAQDRLRIGDYLTVNLGLRADQSESKGTLSDVAGNRSLDFGFSDMIAPRIGVTWDPLRNGKSKVFAHYGKFYESVPLDINVRAFSNEEFNLWFFQYPDDGSLPTADNLGQYFYLYALGGGTLVDPDIDPMYTEEIVGGIEYEVMPNLAVGIKYIDRELGDVIEDVSVDGGVTYFITNPGFTTAVNPVTGEALPEPVTFPDAVREYQAIELTVNKRYSDNWQLGGSYVNAENVGNYGGLFRQENGQLDPNITSLFDLPDLLVGAYGPLPNDREHQAKLFGSYTWPFRLVTGFYAQYLSGTPISKLGSHSSYGEEERFVTPRGSAGRTDEVWNLDLHLTYPISFGGDLAVNLIADVFNLTDNDAATQVDQEWTTADETDADPLCGGPGTGPGTACELGNALWGTPTAYQTPRTIRFGVKLGW